MVTDRIPDEAWLALFTATPDDGGCELSGLGYQRQKLALRKSETGEIETAEKVTFTASGGDWPRATHWAVSNAETGGDTINHGAFDQLIRNVSDRESLVVDDHQNFLKGA